MVRRVHCSSCVALLGLTIHSRACVQLVVTNRQPRGILLWTSTPGVDDDWYCAHGIKATAYRVQVELAQRDPHSPCSKITKSEDPPSIAEHDAVADRLARGVCVELAGSVLSQGSCDLASVASIYVASASLQRDRTEGLTRRTDSGRVGNRQELSGVRKNCRVAKLWVAREQLAEPAVRFQTVTGVNDLPDLRKRLSNCGRCTRRFHLF